MIRTKLFLLAMASASAAAVIESCSDDPVATGTPDAGAPSLADATPGPITDGGFNDVAVYLGVNAVCDGSAACGPGLGCCEQCCITGKPSICTPLVDTDGGAKCPLPDLVVNAEALKDTAIETVEAGTCELEEACLGGPGLRKVLRFDAFLGNRGTTDLLLGSPEAGTLFHYAACHMHYHFDDFAKYTLYDQAGQVVLVGRKQAFCARDNAVLDLSDPSKAKYDCVNQGISKGWEDWYPKELPCQWLDITDLPSGTYRLEVEVNPLRTMTELDYDNNTSSTEIVIP